jgi:hypothetical protein
MATTSVTPNAGATGADAGAAPAAGSTSTGAQPQHSSDRALANFTSTDPDKGGKPAAATDASAAASATAATDGTAAAAAGSTDLAALDIKGILGDDLAAPDAAKPADAAAAAAATTDAADPLEALKDNPRVKELVQAETTLKGLLTGKSEYVTEPRHIDAAIVDADVLWKISEGKMKVDAILDPLKTVNPAQHKQVLEDLRAYLLKETGVPVAAAAAGQPDLATMTPEQKDIYELKKKIADRDAADQKAEEDRKRNETLAVKVKEVNDAKTKIQEKLPELLVNSVFEGESDHFFNLVGAQLAPKQAELIKQIAAGDFKLLTTAIKQVRSAEATRFAARIERAIALQKKKAATIPNQTAGGTATAGADAAKPPAQTDKEARLKNMVSTLRTGS